MPSGPAALHWLWQWKFRGLSTALHDVSVAEALLHEGANIILIQWMGSARQIVSVPWHEMANIVDVMTFAALVKQTPRVLKKYSTAIADALIFSANQFDQSPSCRCKVIDVSGDGASNEGAKPEDARDRFVKL